MKRTFPTIGFALFGLMAGLTLPGTHLLAQESPSESGLPGSPIALFDEPITNLGVVAGDSQYGGSVAHTLAVLAADANYDVSAFDPDPQAFRKNLEAFTVEMAAGYSIFS